uniref:Putative secreted protein n=1 Tax=Ixodes ricinus TaxID=34613 RepID=A0A6B0U9Z8_IXORI
MKELVFLATSVVDAATTATSVQRLVWHVFCVERLATLRWFVGVAAHRRRPSSVTRGERRSGAVARAPAVTSPPDRFHGMCRQEVTIL